MKATAMKTSLENKYLGDGDYFALLLPASILYS